MKNYTNYELEDFVQDPYFRKWVLGKLASDDGFWRTWQDAHPEQYEAMEQARNLVVAFQCENIESNSEEIKSAIESILVDSKMYPLRASYLNWAWKIAASLLLVSGLFLYFSRRNNVPASEVTYVKAEVNNESVPRTFRLSDSTMVTLSPKSQLIIDRDFGKSKREVYLTGEAFFHVTRNVEKPFYVYTGDVVTKVLGTSFRIKAFSSDENVSVAVCTGKVTVFKQKSSEYASHSLSEEIILVPNQQAVYQKTGERLIKTLVENPLVLDTDDNNEEVFDFTDTPIPQVLYKLEKAYGVKIVFDEELLQDCNFTARLTNEPLFEKLNLVCETIQARYEVLDGQVVIYARKCQVPD